MDEVGAALTTISGTCAGADADAGGTAVMLSEELVEPEEGGEEEGAAAPGAVASPDMVRVRYSPV